MKTSNFSFESELEGSSLRVEDKLAYSAEAASAAKAGQPSDKPQTSNIKCLNFDFCLPAAASAKAGCLNFKRPQGAF